MNKGDMISYLLNMEHELRARWLEFSNMFGPSDGATVIEGAKWSLVNDICCHFGLEDRLIR